MREWVLLVIIHILLQILKEDLKTMGASGRMDGVSVNCV